MSTGDGQVHRTIRLGKVDQRHAEAVNAKIEAIVSAQITKQPLSRDAAEWLVSIDDDLHAKLSATGIVKTRLSRTLEGWSTAYRESKRAEWKPENDRKVQRTIKTLIESIRGDTPLHLITAEDASAWRQSLLDRGLSVATVKTHTGNAKTIFREAVRRELIPKSPFEHLKGGVTPTSNTRYVTPDEIERVIAACPDAEWRLLVGLARYAGLRTPSETHLLTWADVDFEKARLRVRSPKTERHPGHEQRIVPICPRLMRLLQERYDAAQDGEERLVTVPSAGGRRRKMVALMKAAGVDPWADTWQTLRRSCEIEWAQRYPQFAVSRWIGHSITVSGRHYANAIPDELFAQVAAHTPQIPPQHGAAGMGVEQKGPEQPKSGTRHKCAPDKDLQHLSERCRKNEKWSRGESNARHH